MKFLSLTSIKVGMSEITLSSLFAKVSVHWQQFSLLIYYHSDKFRL